MFCKNMYIYILSYTYAFYIYYFKEVFSYMIDSSTNLANTSSNKPHNYHEQSQIDQTLRLREVLKTLPPFVKDYFRAMEPKSSAVLPPPKELIPTEIKDRPMERTTVPVTTDGKNFLKGFKNAPRTVSIRPPKIDAPIIAP